jgi:hypothetical protein
MFPLAQAASKESADRVPRRRSVGAVPTPPRGDVREHEQVHTREKHQGEHGHRQEAHPVGVPVLKHGHTVKDDDQRKSNGQRAVQLPNPFAPVQWDLLGQRSRQLRVAGIPRVTTASRSCEGLSDNILKLKRCPILISDCIRTPRTCLLSFD